MKRNNSSTSNQNFEKQKMSFEFGSLFDSNSLNTKQRSDLRRNLTDKSK